MKISYNLLLEFLPQLKQPPEALAAELSLKLAEVECIKQKGDDYILEIENKALTHRPDCFSHLGIAREIAAYFHLDLNNPPGKEFASEESHALEILIETNSCLRYVATILTVEIRNSPDWLQQFLKSMELRSINNVVDITNYIMLKYGQPLHCFDRSKVKCHPSAAVRPRRAGGETGRPGREKSKVRILVRQAKNKEKIVTIDGKERILDSTMMVIADSNKPIAIAGIMGGKEAEVTNETTEIVLESANFEMYSIRKTSAKLGLRSEASTRFEKNQDPNLAQTGFEQTLSLLQQHAKATLISKVIDVYPEPRQEKTINFNPERIKTFLGINLSHTRAQKFLESLQLQVIPQSENVWLVTIPTLRSDLNIEEDLLEEITRLYGFNHIQLTLPTRNLTPPALNRRVQQRRKAKHLLQALGFDEIYNYSFTNEEIIKKSNLDPSTCLKLKNPPSAEHSLLRQTMVPELLKKSKENLKYYREFKLFEFGIHINGTSQGQLPNEIEHIALVEAKNQNTPKEELYYSLKGKLEYLFKELNLTDIYFSPVDEIPFFTANYQVAINDSQKRTIGQLGLISPMVLDNFEITNTLIAVAEINFEEILNLQRDQQLYIPICAHPEVKEDISLIISKKSNLGRLTKEIKQTGGDLLRLVEIFDVFADREKMKENEKSVSLHLTFQSPTGSLSHQEVSKVVKKISKMVESKFRGRARR